MAAIIQVFLTIKKFLTRISDDRVGVYSAQASFFIVLSAFPIIMLVLTIVGLTSIPQEAVLSVADQLAPEILSPLIKQVIEEMYVKSSGTIISITAITAAWSASKGVLSIMRGLQSIYHIKDDRYYIHQRIVSMLYTIIFIVIVVFTLAILVFGNRLYHFLATKSPLLYNILGLFIKNRALLSMCILILFFIMIYKTVRKSNLSVGDMFPGALFSASGWMLFSFVFSLYIDNFADYSYMYGSLTTIILFMLWLYACMYILFIGAELNVFIKENLTRMKRVYKYRKAVHDKKKDKTSQ